MSQTQRKIARIERKPIIVGALRKHGTIPLIEAPFAVRAFNEEHGTNLKLIGARVADHLVVKTDRSLLPIDAFPSPVDQAIAYEKPGKKFGSTVVFESEGEPRLVLATGRYRREKNIALVVNSLTAEDIIRDGNDLVISTPEDRLIVVPGFPPEDGWYMPHAETIVPHGEKVEASAEARHLWRLADRSYVGLVVRHVFYDSRSDWCTVRARHRSSKRLGVTVEVPEWDVEKFTATGHDPKKERP